MIKLDEQFYMLAYNDKGCLIAKEKTKGYPDKQQLLEFANGRQQADYVKVEKEYRYVTELVV